jgi:hypothetical protein
LFTARAELQMKFSGETLMAYADGELDPQTCREIETALQLEPALTRQLARQHAVQATLRATFAPVLDDAVPQRLIDAARRAASAPTEAEPAVRTAVQASRIAVALRSLLSWRLPGVVAIALLLAGVSAGRLLSSEPTPTISTREGRLLATGALGTALTSQAGGAEPVQSAVLIGLSYLDKTGTYCRTFTVKQSESVAGVACRATDGWHIQALAQTGPKSLQAQYRMAGILVPPLILGAVESTIDGSPLDAQAESAARARNWQR